jgi:Ca2+-binding EF-hand superfamily protein
MSSERLGWSPAKLQRFTDAFESCAETVDSEQILQPRDFPRALKLVGIFPTDEEVDEMLDDINNNVIRISDFVASSYLFLRGRETKKELIRAFAVYDDDGDGKIPVALAARILKSLKWPVPDSQIEKMMSSLDSEGRGLIDYSEMIDELWQE